MDLLFLWRQEESELLFSLNWFLFTCACAVEPYKIFKAIFFVSIEIRAVSRVVLELLKMCFIFEK